MSIMINCHKYPKRVLQFMILKFLIQKRYPDRIYPQIKTILFLNLQVNFFNFIILINSFFGFSLIYKCIFIDVTAFFKNGKQERSERK